MKRDFYANMPESQKRTILLVESIRYRENRFDSSTFDQKVQYLQM